MDFVFFEVGTVYFVYNLDLVKKSDNMSGFSTCTLALLYLHHSTNFA